MGRRILIGYAKKNKNATGAYGAVIADVNDLKRSTVLGKSKGNQSRSDSEDSD